VEFCFMRASRPLIVTGAVALLTGLVGAPVVSAQATSPQQQPAAGQPPAAAGQPPAAAQKNYKDRAEYDLYLKITQTPDPKARLELLNTWQDKYPQTDYSQERSQYFLATLAQLAGTDPTQRQKLIDKASEALKADPKNFRAAYLIALHGPQLGGASPSPDLVTQVNSAAHAVIDGAAEAFDPSKKPANIAQADFDRAKAQATALAHNALAWEASTKKDNATMESEYKASLQADPNQAGVSATFAKMLIGEKKYPEGLFEYARAAQYDGPGALPPAARTQLMDYFNKAYTQFHGSDEGKQALLDQAKTSAVPPENMQLSSQADAANKQADAMNARMASDPAFKLWYSIESSLKADNGQQFFASNMKDVEVPGGAQGVKNFSGTVLTVDPPDRPTKVTLGVDDPTKPDATLEFSQPLPPSALEKIKVGEKLEFGGVVDSFTKDPYVLTFKDPTVPGVQTTAPARKGTTRHR
jgi:Tfp pilus assembly protein PilF